MEKLEQFRDEYMLFKTDVVPNDKDDVIAYLECEEYSTLEVSRGIRSDMRSNKKDRILLNLENGFFSLFGICEESAAILDKESEILDRFSYVMSTHRSFYEKLANNITDENFNEIFKLAQYIGDRGHDACGHFNGLLEGLDLMKKGISYIPSTTDDIVDVKTFFEEELASIIVKGCEKVKK